MRLVKELVLRVWQERKVEVGRDTADAERNAKAIQQKLDRLDEAFIYAKAIDLNTYERQRDRLRQELTLTQIDRHSVELDKFDVEGILAFAERVLPRASDLWGSGLADSEGAAAATVLSRRDCIRRKTICSNRRNHARVQLLNVRRRLRKSSGVPHGIRTRVLALKGPRPGPLDDGDPRGKPDECSMVARDGPPFRTRHESRPCDRRLRRMNFKIV